MTPQMSPNEEGSFYMNMARKYKSEDGARSLSQFCKEENVSYNKMIHMLRTDTYRKGAVKGQQSESPTIIAPLQIDGLNMPSSAHRLSVDVDNLRLSGVEITANGCNVKINECSPAALGILITEIRRQTC